MKAAQISHFGHSDAVELRNVPEPRPNKGEVLIEVHASSINPVDIKIREGAMAVQLGHRLPIVLGSDISGIVKSNVDGIEAGERVYGQASIFRGASGAFAECAVVPRDLIARMPRNLNFTEAASIVLTGTSALEALYDNIRLKRGQKILIHGAAGGIGTAAVQIAKHIGAYVAACASTEDLNYVRQLGADYVIDIKRVDFSTQIANFDAVLDTVGGETYKQSFKVLRVGGTIVSMLEQPDEGLMDRFGVHAIYEFTQINRRHLDRLTELIESGVLFVHVEESFPLEEIRQAFEAKENGHVHGKIAVTIQ